MCSYGLLVMGVFMVIDSAKSKIICEVGPIVVSLVWEGCYVVECSSFKEHVLVKVLG